MIRYLAITAAILLVACQAAPLGTTANTAYSPREQMRTVETGYAAVLVAADAAINTGKLPAGVPAKIAASTQAATAAVKAASASAQLCFRDQATGVVGDAPGIAAGQHCDPSAAGLLISVASAAVGSASGLLGAFGVMVGQ
jgi:hypothetical protein